MARDPPSLIYPIYLSPSSSYSNKVSRNRVLFSFLDPAIRPIASAKPHRLLLANPQSFPSPKHFVHSENVWVLFGYKSPLKVLQWEREREEAKMISH